MRIHIRLFAILRQRAGLDRLDLDLPPGSTAADASAALATRLPALTDFLPKIALAINRQYAQPDHPLKDGDELALLPAVSGGSPTPTDWIAILPDPLPTEKAVTFVTHPSCGGIAVFLGTTRAEANERNQTLIALDYEAYEEMALAQLHQLAAEARTKWPIARLAILHRTGRVEITQPSVLVAVSTPHRSGAFEACQWLMTSLKSSAAIWKKEVWSDGSESWVHPKR